MNKKVLFYALAANIITSFLGALLYKYFCNTNQIYCGDTNQNPLAIYIPLVISGTIFIAVAYFVSKLTSKWIELPILFFIIPAILAAGFNTADNAPVVPMLIFSVPPVLIATIIAWLAGKEKNIQTPNK